MQQIFAGYRIIEPVKYQGSIDTRDSTTGAPVNLWACEHSHDTYVEADACASTQLRHALGIEEPTS